MSLSSSLALCRRSSNKKRYCHRSVGEKVARVKCKKWFQNARNRFEMQESFRDGLHACSVGGFSFHHSKFN